MPGRGNSKLRAGLVAVCAVAALSFAPAARAATVTVDTTADQYNTDPSHCSLREAIKSVDGTSGGDTTGTNFGGCVASGPYSTSAQPPDTIMVPAGSYQLMETGLPEDSDVSGDVDIFRAVNIVGTGNPTIQQAVVGERVLDVTATGKDVSLTGLTITGGDTGGAGGGIHFNGGGSPELTLDQVAVTGNSAGETFPGKGGGIFSDSPITITNSSITGNDVNTAGSGIGNGGGLYLDGDTDDSTGITLNMSNTVVTGNTAGPAAGGGGSGGGIYRLTQPGDSTSTATIQNSDISGNTARNFGGGIYTESDGQIDVVNSLVSGNHALFGRGGGIDAGSQSTSTGLLRLINSTVAGNTSTTESGGIQAGGTNPAIKLTLLFSTIALNTGGSGTELNFDGSMGPKPTLSIMGTLIAASNPGAANACLDNGTNFGTYVDGGYNVSTDPTSPLNAATPENGCGLGAPLQPGNHTAVAGTLLGALSDNGGPTKTMQPTGASQAIDNMPNAVCGAILPAITADQRGFPRPAIAGSACDTGAYELFDCSGTALNAPGPFSGCPPPGGGSTTPPATNPPSTKKKCKKKKRRSASASKKCKKKKR